MQITLDYPIRPQPRWGHGRPPHPRLHAILDRGRERYAAHLDAIVGCRDMLRGVLLEPSPADPAAPAWNNPFFSGLDLAALCMFVATTRPRRYVEVGSGWSTRIVRHAARTAGVPLELISIDPSPRAEIDALCDRVIRQGVEDVDAAFFDGLEAGDIFFIDNSHRVFTNSDVVVTLLEVLPRLRPGVFVHVHDIFLPYDYPPEWNERYYSEQYLLAAMLLAEGTRVGVELPNMFISDDAALSSRVAPLWQAPLHEVQRHGGSFWLRTA